MAFKEIIQATVSIDLSSMVEVGVPKMAISIKAARSKNKMKKVTMIMITELLSHRILLNGSNRRGRRSTRQQVISVRVCLLGDSFLRPPAHKEWVSLLEVNKTGCNISKIKHNQEPTVKS